MFLTKKEQIYLKLYTQIYYNKYSHEPTARDSGTQKEIAYC